MSDPVSCLAGSFPFRFHHEALLLRWRPLCGPPMHGLLADRTNPHLSLHPLLVPGSTLHRFGLAALGWGIGHQLIKQVARRVSDLVDSPLERFGVGAGGVC